MRARATGRWAIFLHVVVCGCGGGGGPPADRTAGPGPKEVTVLAGDHRIDVRWSALEGATSFNVYVASSPGVTAASYSSKPDGARITATTPAARIDGLVNGRAYFVAVTAVGAAGESDPSNEVTATPNFTQALSLPSPYATSIAAIAGGGYAALLIPDRTAVLELVGPRGENALVAYDAPYVAVLPLAAGEGYLLAGYGGLYAARVDATGAIAWQLQYAPPGPPFQWPAVARAPDGGFLLANGTTVLHLDTAGAVLWARRLPGTGHVQTVSPTRDGGVLIATLEGLVARLDATGAVVWSKTLPGAAVATARELAGGDSVVAGTSAEGVWASRLTSAGEPVWQRGYVSARGERDVKATVLDDGGLAFVSRTKVFSVDAGGALRWQRAYDLGSPPLALAQDPDGTLVFGTSSAQRNLVFRVNVDGTMDCRRRGIDDDVTDTTDRIAATPATLALTDAGAMAEALTVAPTATKSTARSLPVDPAEVVVNRCRAAGLAFTVPPRSTRVGMVLDPPVEVTVVDDAGAAVGDDDRPSIVLTVGANPGAVDVLAQRLADGRSGGASFGDVRLDRPGNGYTLVATADKLAPVSSPPFDVAPGAWQPAALGLPLGAARQLVVARDALYAGCAGRGLAKSTDDGATWAQLPGFPEGYVQALAVSPADPRRIYAAANSAYRSTDGGASWTLAFSGSAYALATHPVDAETVYAAIGSSVTRSIDGGATWRTVLTTQDGSMVLVATDPTQPGTIYAASGHNFRSKDSGSTWEPWALGLPAIDALAVDEASGTLYAGTNSSGAFKSTDRGETWSKISDQIIAVPVVDSTRGTIWLRGLRSADGGASFTAVPSTPPANTFAVSKGILLAGGEDALWRSTDDGATWSPSAMLSNPAVRALAIDPTAPSTLYAHTGSWIWKTTDGGAHWTTAMSRPLAAADPYQLGAGELAIDPSAPATIYAASAAGALRSSDGGASFAPAGAGLGGAVLTIGVEAGVVWAGTGQGVFRSTDAGSSWAATGTSFPLIGFVAPEPGAPGTAYATSGQGPTFLRTRDGGQSWSPVGVDGGGFVNAGFVPGHPGELYLSSQRGVYRTRDDGGSWTRLDGQNRMLSAVAADAAGAFYGASDSDLVKSAPDATGWTSASTGLPSPFAVSSLAADPGTPSVVYAGTRHGVFKTTTGGE